MKIVPREAWEALQTKARLWWVGWVLAGVVSMLSLGAAVLTSRTLAYAREIQLRQDGLNQLQWKVVQDSKATAIHQETTAHILQTAGELVRTRIEIKEFNAQCGPSTLTKRKGNGKVTE